MRIFEKSISPKWKREISVFFFPCQSASITSQLPVSAWYEIIGDHTLADAILDIIVHDAHRIELQGQSQRRKRKINLENQ